LPISFWAVGIAARCLSEGQARISLLIQGASLSYVSLLLLGAQFVTGIALGAFWVVGTWRSANIRAAADPMTVWPEVTKFVVGVLVFVQIFFLMPAIAGRFASIFVYLEDDPQFGQVTVSADVGADVIDLVGPITLSLPRRLTEQIKKVPQVKSIRLTSRGGRLGPALEMHDLIKAKSLDTIVTSECSSACAIIFLAGKRRILDHGARLGFHLPSLAGTRDTAVEAKIRNIMILDGVSRDFVDSAMAVPPTTIWYPPEYVLEQAHVITP